jgi:hypothetical protein
MVCRIGTGSKTKFEIFHNKDIAYLSSVVTKNEATHASNEGKHNRHRPNFGHAIPVNIQ